MRFQEGWGVGETVEVRKEDPNQTIEDTTVIKSPLLWFSGQYGYNVDIVKLKAISL